MTNQMEKITRKICVYPNSGVESCTKFTKCFYFIKFTKDQKKTLHPHQLMNKNC